ncbi:MAG: sodium-dependent transporter [Erysipelotrichaceae bacterium]|nr:sodium-dependent transporter [Erysipelotrichaceae bacterium]
MKKRNTFSGKLGFVLSAAGSAVGLGNIWRFPYLAAKYGGGIFLLVYLLLVFTFGYTMIVAETTIGRMSQQSPVGAFRFFSSKPWAKAAGWLNAIIPILIVPYYSVIGGWVCKYLYESVFGQMQQIAQDNYFPSFIADGIAVEFWFLAFTLATAWIIYKGVKNGIEKVSRILMPILIVLAGIISVYSITRPSAMEGVRYFLIPDFSRFSWMTVVSAMGQMFYSLSIAMGIMITFGSYMSKHVSIEQATTNVEIFDTVIAILAGLMIIPAVFAFSKGDPSMLQAGPSLMFITIPKVFASMGLGKPISILFFLLVLFAALTSAISLMESAVSTFEDQWQLSRKKSTFVMTGIMTALGTLSALGYGPLAAIQIMGMSFLDFFDFLTNSIMMPIAALSICILAVKAIGLDRMGEHIRLYHAPFKREAVFRFMIRVLCPLFVLIIFLSSIAQMLGWISV